MFVNSFKNYKPGALVVDTASGSKVELYRVALVIGTEYFPPLVLNMQRTRIKTPKVADI